MPIAINSRGADRKGDCFVDLTQKFMFKKWTQPNMNLNNLYKAFEVLRVLRLRLDILT